MKEESNWIRREDGGGWGEGRSHPRKEWSRGGGRVGSMLSAHRRLCSPACNAYNDYKSAHVSPPPPHPGLRNSIPIHLTG